MPKNIYAVVGATGHIGHVLAEDLLKRGHEVRAVTRRAEKAAKLKEAGAQVCVAGPEDSVALEHIFSGAAAAFVMIPPGYDADDFSAYQDQVGEAIAKAVQKAGVRFVLNLSSIGAQHRTGTGPIAGLQRQEERLNALSGFNIVHLRPGYFMENQFWSIPLIKHQSVNGSPIRADLPIWMVATQDIGLKAAEFLDALDFRGVSVFEFAGPRPATLGEATRILGAAVGNPDLQYVQFSYEDARKAMLEMGMKPSIARLMIEMYQAFNDKRVEPVDKLIGPHCAKTSIEHFAETFRQVYEKST